MGLVHGDLSRGAAITPAEQGACKALYGYTLNRGDAGFTHQHVVDAFKAQHADQRTKPIAMLEARLEP